MAGHGGSGMKRLLIAALVVSGCAELDLFNTQFDDIEPAPTFVSASLSAAPDAPTELKVMTWNIKFGAGRIDMFFECHGDRSLLTADEVERHLTAIADYINEVDPDVLLLQEVDLASKRTDYINQVQWLLDHTSLNHGAYASIWKADFVPSDGIGRINTGQAVLSRWPLVDATRIALPLVSTFDSLRQYFYLQRNLLRARVDVPGQANLFVVDIHTEAFSTDGTKRKQIDEYKAELDRLAADGKKFISGGDLNALPPRTDKLVGFEDSRCPPDGEFNADDYSGEEEWVLPLYDYNPAIPLDEYEADNAAHFTHTTDKEGFWNRKLDFLFTNLDVVAGSGQSHLGHTGTRTMPLSDHAPVSFRVVLP